MRDIIATVILGCSCEWRGAQWCLAQGCLQLLQSGDSLRISLDPKL